MANFVLDKGLLFQGGGAVSAFFFVKAGTVNYSCAANTTAGGDCIGVVQENVDATKTATGKVVVDSRLMGISRVVAGAAVAYGVEVMSDASGRAIAWTTGNRSLGFAMQAATAAGDQIDVLFFPNGRKA
jgi:methionine aminopeptidase